ncbi:MAG: cyclically-permuted mutarotase family protein, partial [Odoribacter splanchnicus]|nr:cyclically-permuted mutarotase family protein [Odoribacter splanchnicus]
MNILKILVLFIAGLCFSLLPGRLSADTKSPGPSGNDNRHNIVSVKELPDLVVSERNGTGEGVSAPFAGMLGDILVVAGGCNFPDKPAAEGGIKKYYDRIYILRHPLDQGSKWEKAGKLPVPVAYGVSVTIPEGIVCVGGNNATEELKTVYLLKWDEQKSEVVVENLPSLPVAMDNMAGASDGKNIYVAGGNVNGKPANRGFVYTMGDKGWRELPPFPGEPRLQPAGVVQNSAEQTRFYLMGGYCPAREGKESVIAADGWSYNPKNNQWYPESVILPYGTEEPMALVGAAGVASGSHHLVFVGGVNRERFQRALDRPLLIEQALQEAKDTLVSLLRQEQDEYMNHSPEWYRFNGQLLIYHTITGTWVTESNFREIAKAGAAVVPYRGKWLVVNGESKPGIRSTGVYVLEMGTKTDFGWINWTVLGVYLLGMLFLGYYFMKRAGSSDDFFKGGGRIPWWAAGISIYATMLSAITYMAIPAKAFATNWTYYVMLLMILVVSFPVVKYYLPFFRRLNVTSAYEYLQRRFNYSTRLMASILFISFMVARTALVLYLPSLALTTVTGIDIYICIILMGLVTVVYCTMGGVEAVVWGDVIQGIILVGGAFFAAGYLIAN